VPDPTDLKSFCAYLVQKYGDPVQITEEQKAEEFRRIYLSRSPVDLCSVQVAVYICGLGLSALPSAKFPRGMRGYNDINLKGLRTIYYAKDDADCGIQNTILHELREIMEPFLGEVCSAYRPLDKNGAHIAANHFASAVLLPQEDFLDQAYQTGFDVIALAQLYNKSCAQVLLRMGEVLEGKLPFCGNLYEPHPERPDCWVASYAACTAKHPDHGIGWLQLDGFFLPKGRLVKRGSLVEKTIRNGQPHSLIYRFLSGEVEQGSWLILTQPQLFNKALSRVAAVMLPAPNQDLLEPQIESIQPIFLEPIERNL